jgi:SAM-dependent methyltransferase
LEPEEYARIARLEETHWWYTGMRRAMLLLLEAEIGSARPRRILDAGCGTGGMLGPLARFGTSFGVDLAPEAAAIWCERGLARVARGSVTALPFPDGAFDLVTSFDVVYHLAVADDTRAFAEFARVLRPEGWLLLRVPAYDFLRGGHDVIVHTRHRYTTRELRRKLVAAGFTFRRLTYFNTTLFPVAAAKRLAEARRRSDQAASDVEEVAAPLNALFRATLWLESELLRVGDLPFGLSAVCLARRR